MGYLTPAEEEIQDDKNIDELSIYENSRSESE